jgi:hypothetical protein
MLSTANSSTIFACIKSRLRFKGSRFFCSAIDNLNEAKLVGATVFIRAICPEADTTIAEKFINLALRIQRMSSNDYKVLGYIIFCNLIE